jgi:hypothetical protein
VYTFHIEAPFSMWFSADSHGMGELVSKPFQEWLLDGIPLIAEVAGISIAEGPETKGEGARGPRAGGLGSGVSATGPTSQGTRNKPKRRQ